MQVRTGASSPGPEHGSQGQLGPDRTTTQVKRVSAEWHQVLNDLAGARAALRTQQVLERRQGQ